MALQPHQERVIEERDELKIKLAKLLSFLDTRTFSALSEAERLRLHRQSTYMAEYAAVLDERIAEF